jgi:hypothetical protein
MTTMSESMQVEVPFLSFEEYYEMTGSRNDPLRFSLRVFSPLVNGPNAVSTSVGYTVWIWYTNVELYGATFIAPQGAGTKLGKVRTVSDQEDRPLSTWLSASSSLASSLSAIPYINTITGPTSVYLKYLSGLAHAFGYSRPLNGEPVRPMAPHLHNALANSDGVNVGTMMAINHDAKSRLITDYSPQGMDEMSINFIKRQWSYVNEFSMSTSDASGAQLWQNILRLNMGNANLGSLVSVCPLLTI